MDLIFFNPDIFMYRSFLRCFFNHRIYKNHTVTLAVVKFVISYQNIFYSALLIPVVCIAGNVNGRHTQFTECIIFNDNRFSACNQSAKAMQIAQVHIFYADISTQPEKGSRRIPYRQSHLRAQPCLHTLMPIYKGQSFIFL